MVAWAWSGTPRQPHSFCFVADGYSQPKGQVNASALAGKPSWLLLELNQFLVSLVRSWPGIFTVDWREYAVPEWSSRCVCVSVLMDVCEHADGCQTALPCSDHEVFLYIESNQTVLAPVCAVPSGRPASSSRSWKNCPRGARACSRSPRSASAG